MNVELSLVLLLWVDEIGIRCQDVSAVIGKSKRMTIWIGLMQWQLNPSSRHLIRILHEERVSDCRLPVISHRLPGGLWWSRQKEIILASASVSRSMNLCQVKNEMTKCQNSTV